MSFRSFRTIGYAWLVAGWVTTTQGAPYESTYEAPPAPPIAIVNATLLSEDLLIEDATIVLSDGVITALGADVTPPPGARIVNADGGWVTPGIIDVHSHLGVYPAPSVAAHSDGNESTAPVTAEVWAEHSVWPQDPGLPLALAGSVTTLHVLPGSANLIGGRGVTLKNVPGRSVYDMAFPESKHSLKIACGENPKRVYGSRNSSPATRMGNVAGYRTAWINAKDYQAKVERAAEDPDDEIEPPKRDLELDTLAGVLAGEILVHNHCYRADEMIVMIEIAREFDFAITAFHHAVESYKIADVLADEQICTATWADWWGFKMEAFDAIPANVPLVEKAGACAIVHSDSATDIQRLNQEAAKAAAAGARIGVDFPHTRKIAWITSNPARALGLDDRIGTLTVGKSADVALWNGDPFSVYSRAMLVTIDGVVRYERGETTPVTDFELGLREEIDR